MEAKKKYFMDCHLAGRKYHDADEVWDQLKVGTVLSLVRDLDNRYDKEAVAVVYRDKEQKEDFLIGYLPREDNEAVAALLDMGWTDLFECRINKVNAYVHPEQQIGLTIKIKRNRQCPEPSLEPSAIRMEDDNNLENKGKYERREHRS